MGKFKLIPALVVLAGLLFFALQQYRAITRLRNENDSLRNEFAQLQGDRELAANVDAATNAVAQEQLGELLKLRNEVTQLRERSNQLTVLRQENERLQASLKDVKAPPRTVPTRKGPQDALPQDIHPKDTWAYRGYTTPEATIETLHWAMLTKDKETFLAGLGPEMRSKIESDLNGKDFAKEMDSLNPTEFRILDRQVQSDDEMIVTIYSVHKDANGNDVGNPEDTVFKRIDGQWKVNDSVK